MTQVVGVLRGAKWKRA